MKPQTHVLFLCVANSARSQMAEGLARQMYPELKFSSAGSEPTRPNPYALQALAELGIDASTHTSDSVSDVDADSVDLVITLCAEEVCPVFLGDAPKMHWAFPDPDRKNADLTDAQRLEIFRETRDAIRERLRLLSFEATGISPVFVSTDVARALSTYSKMGFRTNPYVEGGRTIYGFVCLGTYEFHIASVDAVVAADNTSAAYLYVNDADMLYEVWSTIGLPGRLVAPEDTPYGLREFAYVDEDGNLLRIGSEL